MPDTKIWDGTDAGNEGDWSVAANWLPAGVPVATDNVHFTNSSQSVTAGLDQSAVALGSLNQDQSYTGEWGDDDNYLQVGASVGKLGYHYGPGTPNGSPRLKWDSGDTASVITVYNTGTPMGNKPALQLKANNAATTIEVRKGKVGIAFDTGETSTISKWTTSYVSHKKTDAEVIIGEGVTLTTYEQTGGDNVLQCAATTVNADGGSLLTTGSGAIATLNARGADVVPNSTGTITLLDIDGGNVDMLKSAAARTVTTCKLDEPGSLKFDPAVVTFTNKIISDHSVVLRASAA